MYKCAYSLIVNILIEYLFLTYLSVEKNKYEKIYRRDTHLYGTGGDVKHFFMLTMVMG
jgi:hypothetical protein